MCRVLSRIVFTARTLLLLGVLLILVYVLKVMIDIKMLHAGLRVDSRQISPPTQRSPNSSDVFPGQRCETNTSVTSFEDFSSFPESMKDFLFNQHCRHFPLLLDLPHKCGGAARSSEVFLLLVIKSSPQNYDRRAILRQTWAKERVEDGVSIKLVFLAGVTSSGLEKQKLNKVLQVEHEQNQDILQWDFQDSFYNLTLKQTLFLEWMDRNCPHARFLFNGDDDVFVNTDNIIMYLKSLKDNDGSKHLFVGFLIVRSEPVRTKWNKYFVPAQLYNQKYYPPYCSGGGFVLSGYTALVIHQMSKSIPFIPIDDAYMGMCMAKAGLSPEDHLGVKTLGLPNYVNHVDSLDPCIFKELLVVHRFFSAEMNLVWHKMKDPSLKCFGNK